MNKTELVQRIFSQDASVWSKDESVQKIINNRLGWVYSADFCLENLSNIEEFSNSVKKSGITDCVVLAMGGSALAPELFGQIFEGERDINVQVLDTCHSEQIENAKKYLNLETTLFIVASKSGSTLETKFLMEYFYSEMRDAVGEAVVGDHFVAIADEGSDLQRIAGERKFLKTFINPTDIGGRFSALSYFGLVPAALMGMPVAEILASAKEAEHSYESSDSPLGVELAEWMWENYSHVRDKMGITASKEHSSIVLWVEQLVAESLGKQGHGILPFWEMHPGATKKHATQLDLSFGVSVDEGISFETDGNETSSMAIEDSADLGAFFYHWEFAVAYVGAKIGVNPFDEPNVAEAKSNTNMVLEGTGGPVDYIQPKDVLNSLECDDEGYLAVLSYASIDDSNWQELDSLKQRLQGKTEVPVAMSFGPRYLHSTGQLHKGGKKNGTFLIVLNLPDTDLEIPGSDYSFNTFLKAQAEGDYLSLKKRGLKVDIVAINDFQEIV